MNTRNKLLKPVSTLRPGDLVLTEVGTPFGVVARVIASAAASHVIVVLTSGVAFPKLASGFVRAATVVA